MVILIKITNLSSEIRSTTLFFKWFKSGFLQIVISQWFLYRHGDIDFVSVRLKRLSWMSGTQSAYRMSVFVAGKWKEYLSTLKIWQAVWWREWTPLPDWYHQMPHENVSSFSSFLFIWAYLCQILSKHFTRIRLKLQK